MNPARFEPDRREKTDHLKKFTGNIHEYQMWRDRIVDFLCRTNRHLRVILDAIQVLKTPVTKDWLSRESHAGYSG